jgi:hypothetical protein
MERSPVAFTPNYAANAVTSAYWPSIRNASAPESELV